MSYSLRPIRMEKMPYKTRRLLNLLHSSGCFHLPTAALPPIEDWCNGTPWPHFTTLRRVVFGKLQPIGYQATMSVPGIQRLWIQMIFVILQETTSGSSSQETIFLALCQWNYWCSHAALVSDAIILLNISERNIENTFFLLTCCLLK